MSQNKNQTNTILFVSLCCCDKQPTRYTRQKGLIFAHFLEVSGHVCWLSCFLGLWWRGTGEQGQDTLFKSKTLSLKIVVSESKKGNIRHPFMATTSMPFREPRKRRLTLLLEGGKEALSFLATSPFCSE